MGKLFLILLAAAASAGLYHAVSVGGAFTGAAGQAAEQHRLALARAASGTGWAEAKQALLRDFSSQTIEGLNDGTAYTVEATVTGDRALVVSVGRHPRPGGLGETSYRTTTAIRKNPPLTPRPRFMDFALFAEDDLTLGGTADIVRMGVTDASKDTLTVAVHTNGTLSRSGSAVVRAFGSYSGGVVAGTDAGFLPPYNPDGLPSVYHEPTIAVPAVDPDALVAEDGVDYEYPPGTKLKDRTLPGGSRLQPKIYRFRGAVELTNVTVSGYAVLVADGDVTLNKRLQGQAAGYTGPQESALAVYTPGTITIGGNTVVYAQIMAGSGVKYTGTVSIYGNLVLNGSYDQAGTATIYYRPASAGLTQGFTGRPHPGFTLLAVREQ